jgi:hypothetical protein
LGSIRNQIVRAVIPGAISVAAVAAFITPASAAQTGGIHLAAAAHATATAPNTNIEGSPAKWDPTKITAKPSTGSKCTTADISFSITNKTKKSQTVQDGSPKQTLATLKAGAKEGICVTGSKGSTGDLYIKGSKSVLTITLS